MEGKEFLQVYFTDPDAAMRELQQWAMKHIREGSGGQCMMLIHAPEFARTFAYTISETELTAADRLRIVAGAAESITSQRPNATHTRGTLK